MPWHGTIIGLRWLLGDVDHVGNPVLARSGLAAGSRRGWVMIGIESLTKSYGSTLAVDGMSFVARSGRVTGLLGRNGAGKSTTLRILLGLSRPDHGSADFDGTAYRELADPLRAVGAVLEDPAFHPGRTGLTHLRAVACAAKLPLRRVEEVLGQVELGDAGRRRVGGYSLGMRQRLGLAAAMIGNPATLVLDEPQNGLDPQGIQWLRVLLRRLADEGLTCLSPVTSWPRLPSWPTTPSSLPEDGSYPPHRSSIFCDPAALSS